LSDSLVQITDGADPVLPTESKEQLNRLYADVPGVRCACEKLGQCCELTEEEAADDWATMYPLYAVEYLNIVDYVSEHFSPEEKERVLSFDEERPMRCLFLTDEGGCSIHPARPLACRTYGVMSQADVSGTKDRLEGEVPSIWLRHFEKNETCTVCPHTEVEEPEKVDAHGERMATFSYDREMLEMAKTFDGLEEDRRDLLIKASGKYRISRWTWGGFNTLWRKPIPWLKKHLVGTLDRAALAE